MSMSKKSREQGQALVEMAFFLLLFLLIVFMIVDLGRAVYDYSVVYNSAREGARAGIVPLNYGDPLSKSDLDLDGIENAVHDRAVGVDISSFNRNSDINLLLNPYRVEVTVRTTFVPVTPLIRNLTGGDIVITSTSTMDVEK